MSYIEVTDVGMINFIVIKSSLNFTTMRYEEYDEFIEQMNLVI